MERGFQRKKRGKKKEREFHLFLLRKRNATGFASDVPPVRGGESDGMAMQKRCMARGAVVLLAAATAATPSLALSLATTDSGAQPAVGEIATLLRAFLLLVSAARRARPPAHEPRH